MEMSEFYGPWETVIDGFAEIDTLLGEISERWLSGDRQFAWRGVADADYPLHSSLYRRLLEQREKEGETAPPTEEETAQAEMNVLIEAHRWGLHNGPSGRLSVLNQLATLQHFGAPTRLIDVSLNAYIGLWFAVEKHDNRDGRLFAVDITKRLINEQYGLREWEDRVDVPWPGKRVEAVKGKDGKPDKPAVPGGAKEWESRTFAWKPSAFERRIAAQNGAFLFGGVARSDFQVPKAPGGGQRWKVHELRSATSVPLRLHKADPLAGGVPHTGAPAYTFRISAKAKVAIRKRLEAAFGYSHRTIYPDFPGFADYLRSSSHSEILTRARA